VSVTVDPSLVLRLLAADVPSTLHPNLLLAGSLAAAYHYRTDAQREVLTKDADLVVQPAGATSECLETARQLLEHGWRPTPAMKPGRAESPDDDLTLIRLYPPNSEIYFVELMAMPAPAQVPVKTWVRVELQGTAYDGWYVVPSFRYVSLFANDAQRSEVGIHYASPALMALANMLSHQVVGKTTIAGSNTLRSAKDLGRAITLARLATAEDLETWPAKWWAALQAHFVGEASDLARRAGDGVKALLADGDALVQAVELANTGLLVGRTVTRPQFEIAGEQLLVLVADLVASMRSPGRS